MAWIKNSGLSFLLLEQNQIWLLFVHLKRFESGSWLFYNIGHTDSINKWNLGGKILKAHSHHITINKNYNDNYICVHSSGQHSSVYSKHAAVYVFCRFNCSNSLKQVGLFLAVSVFIVHHLEKVMLPILFPLYHYRYTGGLCCSFIFRAFFRAIALSLSL